MVEPLRFTAEQRKLYREAYASTATDAQFELLISECERRALIPGVHVFFQTRNVKEYSQQLQREIWVSKVILVTGITALRLISERSGNFEGYGKFIYYYNDTDGNPTIKSDVPLGRIPHAVGIEMYRKGWRNPVFATARFAAYVQLKQDGKPNHMWETRGEEQLAKCAEAAGHRMVSPEECGNLYIAEEFEHEDRPATLPVPEIPAVVPVPTMIPPVNQALGMPPTIPVPLIPPPPFSSSGTFSVPVADPKSAIPAVSSPVAEKVAPSGQPEPKTQPAGGETAPMPSVEMARAVPVVETTQDGLFAQPTVSKQTQTPVTVGQAGTSAPVQKMDTDAPCTLAEYNKFLERATKIVRDRLPTAGVKDAGQLFKTYLLKQSGKATIRHISAATFERLLAGLEVSTAEAAANSVREGAK
jgi:hypothetical protein